MTTIRIASSVLVMIALCMGCNEAREGDRCNPDLSHDECNAGLTCQQPSTCAENYCCPDPASSSSNGYCNGSLCPMIDAGAIEDDASAE